MSLLRPSYERGNRAYMVASGNEPRDRIEGPILTCTMCDAQNGWERIQFLFEQAIKLAPEKRPDCLEQVCEGDRQLRAESASLLASYEAGEDDHVPRTWISTLN